MGQAYKNLLITVFLAAGSFYGTPARADITTGLIGWWTLDDGSGTTAADSSGSGNTGTLHSFSSPATSTSGWTANGKIGGALVFDHNSGTATSEDYVDIGSSFVLSNSTPLTISWWEKVSDTALAFNDRFNFKVNGSTREFLAFRTDNSSYQSFAWIGWASGNYLRAAGTPSVASSVGVWHHWVLVCSTNPTSTTAGDWTVYVDKVAYTASAGSNSAFSGNTHNQFGASAFAGEAANAALDDVRVYNRALSSSDVTQLYNLGFARFVSGISSLRGVSSIKY